MGAQIRKQKNNGQEKKERKNKKNEKRQHSIQRECVRKKTWALSFYIYMYVCVYRFGEKVMQRVQPKLKLVDFIWYELV